jgi:hypothetical protein
MLINPKESAFKRVGPVLKEWKDSWWAVLLGEVGVIGLLSHRFAYAISSEEAPSIGAWVVGISLACICAGFVSWSIACIAALFKQRNEARAAYLQCRNELITDIHLVRKLRMLETAFQNGTRVRHMQIAADAVDAYIKCANAWLDRTRTILRKVGAPGEMSMFESGVGDTTMNDRISYGSTADQNEATSRIAMTEYLSNLSEIIKKNHALLIAYRQHLSIKLERFPWETVLQGLPALEDEQSYGSSLSASDDRTSS